MNQIVKWDGLDVMLDATTWSDSSYADVHSRLMGKKTDKGGQHVLLLDAWRRYMYAWTPHYKFFPIVCPFTALSPAEVVHLIESIAPLVIGAEKDEGDKRCQIFSEKVHITMDNFFSGDDILKYISEGGWKATMTCRRDRLPVVVPKTAFHYLKGKPVMIGLGW